MIRAEGLLPERDPAESTDERDKKGRDLVVGMSDHAGQLSDRVVPYAEAASVSYTCQMRADERITSGHPGGEPHRARPGSVLPLSDLVNFGDRLDDVLFHGQAWTMISACPEYLEILAASLAPLCLMAPASSAQNQTSATGLLVNRH
jgi:hypothetical protein